MGPTRNHQTRPTLSLTDGKLFIHGSPARTVFRKHRISIGCTDVEPEALRFLLEKFDEWQKREEYVLQP
jgi:hypothetical protein